MQFVPTATEYEALRSRCSRVPICGEESFPDFDAARLFQELFGQSEESFLLESGKGPRETARFSFMGEGNTRRLKIQNGSVVYQSVNGGPPVDSTMGLDEGLELLNFDPANAAIQYLPHFWGGWVGFIGYEAGRLFEPVLPAGETTALPDAYFILVDRLWVYDHSTRQLKYIVSTDGKYSDINLYEKTVNEIRQAWQRLKDCAVGTSPSSSGSSQKKETRFKANMTREQYIERVQKVRAYISEGDIYQANIAQKFETESSRDPFELYCRLRQLNPSPFSGFLKLQDIAIVSSSPERLVKLEGDHLETRPIAGTRPRGKTPQEDRHLSAELLLSEKEKAEHLMLVDLERNDLGRVCESGSVEVDEFMILEQYSHVHHIVSNIRGRLKPGMGVREILTALFPGGTISGCPKIRCMEIIHQLEPSERGPYSGSFGYIGFSPLIDLNIIIRSIVMQNGKASFHVGAGIVADSDPQREYEETLHKAAALIEIFQPRNA